MSFREHFSRVIYSLRETPPGAYDMTILAFFLDGFTIFAKNNDGITIFAKKNDDTTILVTRGDITILAKI